ncbi:hypothetical protein Scep_013394 [Stephania cephalantha]|uniref:DUF4408 domain-containing protein n=1 Tax=Stephania cephalantha TaxID=152367 RepID=A0AAP0JH11_9MAGN
MAAALSGSSGHRLLSPKVLLLSTAVLSAAVLLKLCIPLVLQFAVAELPGLWTALASWLTPPYLYVVINGIIITIAASSRFHHKIDGHQEVVQDTAVAAPVKVASDEYDSIVMRNQAVLGFDDARNGAAKGLEENELGFEEVSRSDDVVDDDFVISRSDWTPSRSDVRDDEVSGDRCLTSVEKPLVSSRFGHRKTVKASPEGGKALGVAKPKRYDTLETTWKTITDGRPIPLARHLKKSDTWETHGRHGPHDHHNSPGDQQNNISKVKKSETFKERGTTTSSASPSPGSGKVRREPSLSQDDLNRRVEAFIKKFNEEMRLQRQESLNQYWEMVNRGAH